MPHPSWNESYASGHAPWDTGEPELLLVEFVTSGGVTRTRTLEIGSGTGTNAIWLAERGFDVLGIDVLPLAVERAHAKLAGRSLSCRFATCDILAAPPPEGLGMSIVVLGITYLSLIVGELVPKRIALHNPERIMARVALFCGPALAAARMPPPGVQSKPQRAKRARRIPEQFPSGFLVERCKRSLYPSGISNTRSSPTT